MGSNDNKKRTWMKLEDDTCYIRLMRFNVMPFFS